MMEQFAGNLVWAVGGIVALMIVGGLLPRLVPRWRVHMPLALAAAAGIMLATAICHLVPEAYALLGSRASFGILGGFVVLYLFERFLTIHICETFGCHVHTVGLSALFGLSLHTFANGVALGAGLMQGLGGLVFLAIAAHKLPEAFSLTAILTHEQYRTRSIVWMNLLFMAMIPLGALAVRAVAAQVNDTFVAWALAFSAGTFLHVAVSDLLPEVHRTTAHRGVVAVAFLGGMAVVALLGVWVH
ncbi:MAG: ZIP family metal transporter [Deltaproteobacteria bacterium]|nr:ZIP family metal transporter [Deltaproteobacteria bacterium]